MEIGVILQNFLDSTERARAQVTELSLLQHHFCREYLGEIAALTNLPVSIDAVIKTKGSFQVGEKAAEQCRGGVSGKENHLAGGPQSKASAKASAKGSSRKRRKPLVDSQVVNKSRQLEASSPTGTHVQEQQRVNEGLVCSTEGKNRGNEGLVRCTEGKNRGNEGLVRCTEGKNRGNEILVHFQEGSKRGDEGNNGTALAAGENEELIHSLERKRSRSTSVSPVPTSVAGEAEERLPHLKKPRGASTDSSGGRPSQEIKTEVAPDLNAPRLTRHQAKILQNAGANITVARGEPPLKKRRGGRKGKNVNSDNSLEAVAEKAVEKATEEDGTARIMETAVAQAAMKEQNRDEPPSQKRPAVKKRNTRSSSRSPAAETNGGEVAGRIPAGTGEDQDMKVAKLENRSGKTPRSAKGEEDKEGGNAERRRPSKKSRTSLKSTRLNSSSQAEPNVLKSDKVDNVRNDREEAANKTREANGKGARATIFTPSAETDWIMEKFGTVGMIQAAGMHQNGKALHPLEKRNGMESPQSGLITPSPRNGNAEELRISRGAAKISEKDLVADSEHVNALRPDRGPVKSCTDLASECLASPKDPPKSRRKRFAFRCSRRTTLLLSPQLKTKFVEKEGDVLVVCHPELKDRGDTISISEVVEAEEQVEMENPPQPRREEGYSREFSFPLAETDANSSRSIKVVGHSVLQHCSLAVELDIIKESKMDAMIGDESADFQFPLVREAREQIEETKDVRGTPLLKVSIPLPYQVGDIVDQTAVHISSPGTALQPLESVDVSESSNLAGQSPQTHITHENNAETPTGTEGGRERRLTELIHTTPEREGDELVGEESSAVKREKRKTLLLTTSPEVRPEELIDVETGAVPCSQLKINEGNLFETSAMNSQIMSKESHQDSRWEGELKVVSPLAVDMNPSERGHVGRNETTASLKNRQMNVSRMIPSVQKWDKRTLLALSENKSLVSILSSFGRASPAPVNDNHRADNVGVQRNPGPSCELRDDGKEVSAIVTPLDQSSKSSRALGRNHMKGIVPVDHPPPNANAQYCSDMRLSKLMPTKQVERSWMVAHSGEDNRYQSRVMKPQLLHDTHEGSFAGNGIEKKSQPQRAAAKLDLLDRGANNAMAFSSDESSVSWQNMKASDLLLELWKRGGMPGSGSASHGGPLSSEGGRNYKVDVVDEVYRSVVVRECGGSGAMSSFTLPIGNWSSGIVCNMTGASSQFDPRVMESSLPFSRRPEIQEVAEVDSLEEDLKSDQERKIIKPSSPLRQDEDQDQDEDPEDSVSALANSGVVECSQEIDNVCEIFAEHESRVSEQPLQLEDLNMSKPSPVSKVEEDLTVSSIVHKSEGSAVPVVDPCCTPVGPVDTQQFASSDIVKSQKPLSNLISGMKTFVPVVQQPAPSFIPDGKRPVKVKALMAAEAAKKAEEEKREMKDRLRKNLRKAEDNASFGMEKKEAAEARMPPKESVEGNKFDGAESSCGSQLSPRKQVLIRNSRNLFSPEAKSKQSTNLETEKRNQVRKNQAELKRMEEERKRKLLASRQLKEQLVQQKMEKRQEVLKQKKEKKVIADLEDKKHQASVEGEREKKAMEERIKSKQCTPGRREKEYLKEGSGQGTLQRGQARPGQTPYKTRSNLLGGGGSLSSRSAVRIPIVSKDKQTAAKVAAAIQRTGRHPSSSSSSSKLLSLNAESARLLSLNAEPARLPSWSAEPARFSSLNAQRVAEGGSQNSARAFSLGNRPADVLQQVRTGGDSVSCSGTPCSRAVDLGPMSYEITPYRGSSDEEESEDEREQPPKPAKHIPFWSRRENLEPHLLQQAAMDPDEIFSGWKICSLKEVFGKTGSKKIRDFGKRSGSGDWFRDRVSWREELQYKIDMGFVHQICP
ncbi:unnamed protein product [Calypogeia fissa]